tara:strand:+ start:282 stop:527 length:246 start_codon:yes stop_codon:yes gene_type:complete
MVFDPESWESKFPKFVIGDSPGGRTFVIHFHHPRFVAELIEDGEDETFKPSWIDEPPNDVSYLARLMRETGDFYVEEIERE